MKQRYDADVTVPWTLECAQGTATPEQPRRSVQRVPVAGSLVQFVAGGNFEGSVSRVT